MLETQDEGKKMIRSMTGFGRGETVTEQAKITIEMKAVNHRYCDLNVKLPRKLNYLDTAIRNQIKKAVQRGKIDVFISYEDLSDKGGQVKCDLSMGRAYYEALQAIHEELDIPNQVRAYEISRMPEVVTLEDTQIDIEEIKAQLFETLDLALAQFNESRVQEGDHLREDIFGKLDGMLENVAAVEARYPQMVADYRAKLEAKVKDLLDEVNIDEARLATEIVIYADKISVDEETVRLRSHIQSMKKELEKGVNVGRKLDFLAQEMNREANTILSKANDISVSGYAIDLKTDIEKIREQVQNIE